MGSLSFSTLSSAFDSQPVAVEFFLDYFDVAKKENEAAQVFTRSAEIGSFPSLNVRKKTT